MKQVISVVVNIPAQGGGITRVSLRRAQELARRGLISRIATLGYRPHLGKSYRHFLKQEIIGSDVQVFNFYTWFAMRSMGIDPHTEEDTGSHTNTSKWIIERQAEIYSRDLNVHRYINPDGNVFIEEYVSADNRTESLESVIISLPGGPPRQFFGSASVHAYWLEQLIADTTPAVLICDHTGASDAVGMVQTSPVYKVLMMHSTHLARPDPSAPIAPRYGRVIRNIKICDSLVLLTQEQLHDINSRLPGDCYHVIGNPIVVNDGEPVERDPDLAVVVARLCAQKCIDRIILAFEKIRPIKPTARLEIWGSGELEQELRDLIEEKGLNESVTLMGFTDDIRSIFKRASVSLGMSEVEGFGMSFAESLAYGTPVVSLKTKYGPKEIITSGEDGFLVDDEDEFVEKVVTLLSDPDLVERMGAVGIRHMQRFSPENIGNLWMSHFKTLLAQPPRCDSILLDSPDKQIFP